MNHQILVCDDQTHIARVIELTIKKDGHDVIVAHDGETAWDLFLAIRPDLLVTDLEMPEPDGLELCRRIRAIPDCDIPIILLTGRAYELQNTDIAAELSLSTILMKPFSPLELRSFVSRILKTSCPLQSTASAQTVHPLSH